MRRALESAAAPAVGALALLVPVALGRLALSPAARALVARAAAELDAHPAAHVAGPVIAAFAVLLVARALRDDDDDPPLAPCGVLTPANA